MSIAWKILAALLLLGGAFAGGYYSRKPTTVVETKVEVKEVEKVVTHRVTERDTRPDGTVREVVTEKVTDVTKRKTDERKAEQPVTTQLDPQWQLGVSWALSRDMDYVPDSVLVGRRLLGPVWGTAGYGIKHNELLIGIQVEF